MLYLLVLNIQWHTVLISIPVYVLASFVEKLDIFVVFQLEE